MKLEQSFEVTAAGSEIETRIAAFMRRNGYQADPALKMSFNRGTRFGSFLSFSPRKWRAVAKVAQQQLGQNHWTLKLTLDINDEGQLVTHHERLYWKAELDNFQIAVQTGETTADALSREEQEVVRNSVKGFLIFMAVGLLVAVPVSVTISLVNPQMNRWAVMMGAFFGITAGLIAAKRRWGL